MDDDKQSVLGRIWLLSWASPPFLVFTLFPLYWVLRMSVCPQRPYS